MKKVILILFALIAIASCEKETITSELDGKWYKYSAVGKYTDFEKYLVFNEDGSGLYVDLEDSHEFYWSTSSGNLNVEYSNYLVGYHYEVRYPMLFLSTETIRNSAYIHE